ncbi:prostaglandin E synthase isoform X1 [Heterocephalus glaber]|uniref:Prostaglandin E synthase n=1 Tax=Heterocephalus glaber TaxID=10181 RepID=A0AAX6TAP1_HETGA|nr:prostaglandin E synthase isoform X1 [Heterocephalus glaber]
MPPSGLALADSRALPAFLLCSTLLVIKMYVVAVITGQVRLRKKAFANPEDALRHGGLQFCRSNPDVERCLRQATPGLGQDLAQIWLGLSCGSPKPGTQRVPSRAHRNDMETIYPFLFLGLVYCFLGPSPAAAWGHFLPFLLGRLLHTVAYLGQLRAPVRSLAYTVAQLPCASMALQILWEAARHL